MEVQALLQIQKNESSRQGSIYSENNRHKKQKSSLIESDLVDDIKNTGENIETISQKFDGLLGMDMRVIDQVIGNDLYNILSQDKKLIREAAQNDLKQCKVNLPSQIKYLNDGKNNELSIDKQILEMFLNEQVSATNLQNSAISKINLLNFDFMRQ